MTAGIAVVIAGAVWLAAAGVPGGVFAATIAVTTRKDVVADDGLCSLREAVRAANNQQSSGASPGECAAGEPAPAIDVIRVPRGQFRLTLGFAGEDAGLEGDLDVTESVVVEGAGQRKTILRSAIGKPAIRGLRHCFGSPPRPGLEHAAPDPI